MAAESSPATRSAVTVGVIRETARGERRVALDPESVAVLVGKGFRVLVEADAGAEAGFLDADYVAAGARIASRTFVIEGVAVLAVVRPPDPGAIALMRPRLTVVGMLDPLGDPGRIAALAARGVTAAAFEMLPRTLSRTQSMDALSSQASAAGYRAALVAATAFDRYLPMMITASGTATPASVLVMGTGVAGLQAIATARRLGAVVSGYDVRSSSREEVESLGAAFLDVGDTAAEGSGGYARALTPAETAKQQADLAALVSQFDIVITTAKVPGRIAPVLVTAATVAAMRRGSICVDLAASAHGGNVEGSVDGRTVVTPEGVTLIGAGELAGELPTSASHLYARNVTALVDCLAPTGEVVVDDADEIHRAVVVCHGGRITNPALDALIGAPAS